MGCGSSSDAANQSGFDCDDPDMLNEVNARRMRFNKKTGGVDNNACDMPEDDFFEVEEAGEGEQFMAVKPWKGQIAEPDNHNPVNKEKPNCSLDIKYAWGYRSADSRQNAYSCNGKYVHFTAALGVVTDRSGNQKYFGGGEVADTAKNVANDKNCHTNDIMCLDVCGDYAVTGQVGAAPVAFVWKVSDCSLVARFKLPKGRRGIQACAINCDGSRVVLADLHNDHHVSCWDVSSGQCLWDQKSGPDKIVDCAFDLKGECAATAGVKHFAVWQKDGSMQKGLFGDHPRTSFGSVCPHHAETGMWFAGGANGKIYRLEGRQVEDCWDAHKGFIAGLHYCPTQDLLWSGGKDGDVKAWMEGKNQHNPQTWSHPGDQIRSVHVCPAGNMVVGTRKGQLIAYEGCGEQGWNFMQSHCDGEVWGLDTTVQNEILTSADDNTFRCWNASNPTDFKCMKFTDRTTNFKRGASTLSNLPDAQCSRAVARCGDYTFVSGNDGCVSVFQNGSECHVIKDAKEWNEILRVSPCGKFLAVGSHDNHIRIYDIGNNFAMCGDLNKHNSFIVALDWSCDSSYIRSDCGAHEHLYFKCDNGSWEQDPSGRTNTTSVEFATDSCHFGWHVDGIFPRGTDGTHINGVCSNKGKQFIFTADDYGLVRCFNNPCRPGACPKSFRGHSEHVVRVETAPDDSYVVSVGGYDQTVICWSMKC